MIDEKNLLLRLSGQVASSSRIEEDVARYDKTGAERAAWYRHGILWAIQAVKEAAAHDSIASKGGHARAAKLPKARRVEIARKAARKRWKTHKPTESYER